MATGTARDNESSGDGCRLSFATAIFVAVAGLIALGFAIHFGLPFVVSDDTALARFPGREVWIVVHVATGSVALLIAPIQILSLYWTIPGQLHRFSGAVYVGAIMPSCVAGAYLAVATENGLVYKIGSSAESVGGFGRGELSSGSTKGAAPPTFAFASPRFCVGDAKAKAEGGSPNLLRNTHYGPLPNSNVTIRRACLA